MELGQRNRKILLRVNRITEKMQKTILLRVKKVQNQRTAVYLKMRKEMRVRIRRRMTV